MPSPLTDIQPRTAKPKAEPYKLSDGGGLYLLVNKDGAKYWRMDYRFSGTRRALAFGKYPEVTLAEARNKRLAARKLLDQGVDPSQDKKERQREQREANANTFEKLAREWPMLPIRRGLSCYKTIYTVSGFGDRIAPGAPKSAYGPQPALE